MAEAAAGTDTGVSLGKGAWDCDKNCEIPPEKEVSLSLASTLLDVCTAAVWHTILSSSRLHQQT
jgi:hypothetical protein